MGAKSRCGLPGY